MSEWLMRQSDMYTEEKLPLIDEKVLELFLNHMAEQHLHLKEVEDGYGYFEKSKSSEPLPYCVTNAAGQPEDSAFRAYVSSCREKGWVFLAVEEELCIFAAAEGEIPNPIGGWTAQKVEEKSSVASRIVKTIIPLVLLAFTATQQEGGIAACIPVVIFCGVAAILVGGLVFAGKSLVRKIDETVDKNKAISLIERYRKVENIADALMIILYVVLVIYAGYGCSEDAILSGSV